MKDCFFILFLLLFYCTSLQSNTQKKKNNRFILADHLAAQAKTGTELNSNRHFPVWPIPLRGGGRRTPLTTGSGRPRWPDYDPSCNPRLRRPNKRRQPAGRWLEPVSRRGCPPASAAPAAAGPWSGWAACPRCPCHKRTTTKSLGQGFPWKEKRPLEVFERLIRKENRGIGQGRCASQTRSVSAESRGANFGSASFLLPFATARQVYRFSLKWVHTYYLPS